MWSIFNKISNIVSHRPLRLPKIFKYARVFGSESISSQGIRALRFACDHVEVAADGLEAYNKDWTGKYVGKSQIVVKPKSTEEVADIMRVCSEYGLKVNVQGGNTGLVGGATPINDEVIVNMGRMNRILSIDPTSGVLLVESGCILQQVDDELAKHDLCVPLDLGAKGSCMIGGNVATNAGGLRFVRYGSLRANVLGLEVVLADGQVMNMMNTFPKDNTGLDIKQLFIGSEGSLGIITKVALQAAPRPKARNVMLIACESFESVQLMVQMTRKHLGEILSAIELMDRRSVHQVLVSGEHTGFNDPFQSEYPYYIIIETLGSQIEHDAAKLEYFTELVLNEGIAADGTVSQDELQAQTLWSLRETIPVACTSNGLVFKYDVSLPIDSIETILRSIRDRVHGLDESQKIGLDVVGYGHLGDSNLHINVVLPWQALQKNECLFDEVESLLEPWIYKQIKNLGGSISAEHGIGQAKTVYLPLIKDPVVMEKMHAFKTVFDPKNILNPGKMFNN